MVQSDDQMMGALIIQNKNLKTPLLAAEGFMIQVIQIQDTKEELNQNDIMRCLTSWGGYPDLLGAYS